MCISVIIADDCTMIRQALRRLLESHADIEVVGQAKDGKDAIERCLELTPDIAIVDVNMPAMNGIEATRQIASQLPQVKVLALSGDPDLHYVRGMLKAGASGYIVKDFICEELVNAVRTIANGGTYLSIEIKCEIISAFYDSIEHLTGTEEALLHKLYEGKHIRDIALYLHLSPKKVYETYQGLLEKTALSEVMDLAAYIIRKEADCK